MGHKDSFALLVSFLTGACAICLWFLSMSDCSIKPASFAERIYITDKKDIAQVDKKVQNQVHSIVWYNPPDDFINHLRTLNPGFNSCKYTNCEMMVGKKYAELGDAVIFDGRYVTPSDFFPRKAGQVWIFAAHEAPVSFMDTGGHWAKGDWVSSFNWTMTYDRSNTDIYLPYGEIKERSDFSGKDFVALSKNKNKTALIVHSHCPTRSKREQFVRSLQKYFNLDSFGGCGKPFECGRRYVHDDCFEIINTYKFYLAFENAFCDQYFTEKLFRNFNYDSIMVVRGGRKGDIKRVLPNDTYISTGDFKSVKSLADYLKKISESESLYKEFLARKRRYYSVPFGEVYQRAMCDLCERMNKQKEYRSLIPNIVERVYRNTPCGEPADLNET